MRIHLVTVGEPKLAYAKAGWQEYIKRLGHYHTLRITHLPDKRAYDPAAFQQAASNAYTVALVIDGPQLNSPELAVFLDRRALDGRDLCFFVGGPEGLPTALIAQADMQLSLSRLTFPHDLGMVVVAEALYRASTIQARQPYHK